MLGIGYIDQIYIMPSLIALALKIWLLVTARQRPWADDAWIWFVAIFALHNFCEVLILRGPNTEFGQESLVRLYYVCSMLAMVYGLNYVIETKNKAQQAIVVAAGAAAVTLMFAFLETNYMVNGVQKFDFTLAAVKGEGFIWFQVFCLTVLTATVGLLVYNYRYAKNDNQRTSIRYTAYAILPLVVLSVVIVVSKYFGLGVNPAMLVPIGSTLFLIISLNGKSKVYDVLASNLVLVPSMKKAAERQVKEASRRFREGESSKKQSMQMVEQALVYIQHETALRRAKSGEQQHSNPMAHYEALLSKVEDDAPANDS